MDVSTLPPKAETRRKRLKRYADHQKTCAALTLAVNILRDVHQNDSEPKRPGTNLAKLEKMLLDYTALAAYTHKQLMDD